MQGLVNTLIIISIIFIFLIQNTQLRISVDRGVLIELDYFLITLVFSSKEEKRSTKNKKSPAIPAILSSIRYLASVSEIKINHINLSVIGNAHSLMLNGARMRSILYIILAIISSLSSEFQFNDDTIDLSPIESNSTALSFDVTLNARAYKYLIALVVYAKESYKQRRKNGKARKQNE